MTPGDPDARVDEGPTLFDLQAPPDEVHISVAFTYDLDRAQWLANQWELVAPISIGGPGAGTRGGEFTPGLYVRHGYTITSRGCNNKCWFCDVPRREGVLRELPIKPGWNILDDNLLACSEGHIKAVFEMLRGQARAAQFTGGLEAALLDDWHIDQLLSIRVEQMFFAYDTPDDLAPLISAGERLISAGFPPCRKLRAFVLCGYPKDSFEAAEKRLFETIDAGFMPMAMLYRNRRGETSAPWRKFQKHWARPAFIRPKIRKRRRFKVIK